MSITPSAVCLGDNCIDIYVPPIGCSFVGGNALNTAVYLRKAGIQAAYVGAVGDDTDGRRVLEALFEQEVNVSHVQILPGETSRTYIALGSGGDRQFILEEAGPHWSPRPGSDDLAFLLQHRLIHTTWLGGVEEYLPSLKQEIDDEKLLISLDYGERYTQEFLDRTIQYVDIAFFSLTGENKREAEQLAKRITERGPSLVVVTLGSGGSLAFDGVFYHQPIIPVEVFDTLGAGDTYIGTFLGHWLQGRPVPECMGQAARQAARTCTFLGAWSQVSIEETRFPVMPKG